MSRVIHYFSSEFGWTVDEILHRTINELELLLEVGLENRQSDPQQKTSLDASDPNQLKAFARKVGIQIEG